MLRVLTLSTLFPDANRPAFGVFVERQVLALAARDDIAVEVVAPVGLPPWPLTLHPHYRPRARLKRREEWKGLVVHRPRFPAFPVVGGGAAAKRLQAILPVLREIRERFPFDVIDAEFFWPDGVAAAGFAKALGVPVSIKARGSDIDHWGRQSAAGPQIVAAAAAADGLLAVSEALRERMSALGIDREKVAVHRTGVDAERFRPCDRDAAKAALGMKGPLVVSAGALIPVKGQRLALAAIAQLPEASLIFVGDGPDRLALEALTETMGLGERVRFLGVQPHEALPALLGAADVLLHTAEREGLANVWVEALACGTPIVVTETGAAHEVVDRPEAGRIVARDAAAIAAALRELLASPPPQDKVRAAAGRFSWERNGAELFAHLERVSSQRH
ncbi:MAG: teichuronic acid biosynthesis glycosyltransferase TuaC [Sphingomonadales bacterium]|jgi:glycosyltransferase involved in cell wall biosynthesis|nr:teichuronic acid biosynthesis glycosyltransferase TuaC [Sphingomonadales bacterium]